MARKFKVGDVVRVKPGRPSPWDGDWHAAYSFRSTRGYGVVTAINALPWPIDVAAGKRGRGETWPFDPGELDLISRPKKGA